MKYCPRCGSEYRPEFDRCPDCDEALVDTLPASEAEPEADFGYLERAVVFTTGRRIDAEVVRGLLEPCFYSST